MSRTLNATLQTAMDSGNFEPIIKVIGLSLEEYELDAIYYKQNKLTLDVHFYGEFPTTNLVKIRRGAKVNGVEYTVDSVWFPIRYFFVEKELYKANCSIFYDEVLDIEADQSYSTLLDLYFSINAEIAYTTTYKHNTADWKSYQYDLTGKFITTRYKSFLSLFARKYFIYATDNDNNDNVLLFSVHDVLQDTPYTIYASTVDKNSYNTIQRIIVSKTEADALRTLGSNGKTHNIGYLNSAYTLPAVSPSPGNGSVIKIIPNLKYQTGDYVTFNFAYGPVTSFNAVLDVTEIFDISKSQAWYMELRPLEYFGETEGGILPKLFTDPISFIPIISSGFNRNLNTTVNNLQALAEAVDNLNIAGGSIPATTAANDFQVGDGAGAWVKKTLAQVITILGIFADAASDSVYYARRNGGWTNLKTYTDTLYSLLGHVHAATDITSGDLALARLALVKFLYPFGSYTILSPVSLTGHIPFSSTLPSFTTYPKYYSQAVFVGATNDSSNYWTIELRDYGTTTTIASVTTQGLATNTGHLLTDSSMALSSLTQGTHRYLYVRVAKTGSPSDLYIHCPAVEYTLT